MDNSTNSLTIQSALALHQAKHNLNHHAFVTITDPRELREGKIKQVIRKHAMKGVGVARRTRPKPVSYTFEIGPDQAQYLSTTREDKGLMISPRNEYSCDHIDVEPESNPWQQQHKMGIADLPYPKFELPVERSPRVLELINFSKYLVACFEAQLKFFLVLRDATVNYRPTWKCWFDVAMTDPCPFYMTLSNAALNHARILDGDSSGQSKDTRDALIFYNLSLQAVQERIQNPMDEGVVGAVLGFACRDV
jgi:hypothetical protein